MTATGNGLGSLGPQAWEHNFGAAQMGQIKRRVGFFVRNQQDRDDIVQQSVLIALEKSRQGSVRKVDAIEDYAVGVARNLLKAEARRRAKDRRLTEALTHEPTPGAAIDPRELRDILAALPVQRDRDVLSLYLVRGLAPSAIAKCEGIKEQHIYRVISRARKRLSEIHKPKCSPAENSEEHA